MEKHVTFNCQGNCLEGKLWSNTPRQNAAIITHPHPLYGGDMNNEVVGIIAKAYQNKGWSTLCFNFRGTGGSRGQYDDGIGEQMDVDAAIDYLVGTGIQEIELAGYSFGSWVLACRDREPDRSHRPMRFIAPPVAFVDFNPISQMEGLQQVIVGTKDEFAPLSLVEALIPRWNSMAEFNVIKNADHFYSNQSDELQKCLEAAIPINIPKGTV